MRPSSDKQGSGKEVSSLAQGFLPRNPWLPAQGHPTPGRASQRYLASALESVAL